MTILPLADGMTFLNLDWFQTFTDRGDTITCEGPNVPPFSVAGTDADALRSLLGHPARKERDHHTVIARKHLSDVAVAMANIPPLKGVGNGNGK